MDFRAAIKRHTTFSSCFSLLPFLLVPCLIQTLPTQSAFGINPRARLAPAQTLSFTVRGTPSPEKVALKATHSVTPTISPSEIAPKVIREEEPAQEVKEEFSMPTFDWRSLAPTASAPHVGAFSGKKYVEFDNLMDHPISYTAGQ